MQKISIANMQNLHEYELARPEFRRKVIEKKALRRVSLGPLMTLVFENRDTVRFQIQEMLRVERIVEPDEGSSRDRRLQRAAARIRARSRRRCSSRSRSPKRIQEILDGFIGLDEPGHLALAVGEGRFPALFAPGQSREDRISAVHYIRFPLGDEGSRALAAGREAALEVAHGSYRARQVLSKETAEELLRDLG